MAVPDLLAELLHARAPTGREDEVAAIVRREAASFGAECAGDVLGSTTALVRGTVGGRLLALAAHADQIGVSVTHAFDDGLLAVSPLGDWPARNVVGQRLALLTNGGVVPGVATRVGTGDLTWTHVRVDVGAGSAVEALSLVRVGDPGVVAGPPVELAGGRVAAAALDNRAGLYPALEALRRLAADPPAWDVVLVATAQEEGPVRAGAAAAIERLRSDAVVVCDVTYATYAAGHDPEEWGEHDLGDGPVVFRGGPVSPVVTEGVLDAARAAGIAHRVETGRATWSDADDAFAAAGGTATGLVSVSLRSMHTANEVVDLADVEAMSRLLEAYARSLVPDASFVR
jgi:endoglucanase